MEKITAVLLIFGIVLISGCVEQTVQEEQEVWGNGVIETGEDCDNTGCEAGQICTESCVCEALTPPQLP